MSFSSYHLHRLPSSLFLILTTLFIFAFLSATTAAHRIDIAPGKKQCFFEDLHVQDEMSITYQVAEGGNMDIDFFLTGPNAVVLSSINKKTTGTFTMNAQLDGRYTYCFSNEMSSFSPKTVSFNVHGVLYVEDEGDIAPVEKEIRKLYSGLQGVKDEQEYIVVRERMHRNTAESTNDRVKWWSIVQFIMLAAVCAWNVHYLKSWFEVKQILV